MKVTRSFKIGSKLIRYVYEGAMKSSEQQAIDKFIGIAYNMSVHAIKQIEANTPESEEFFTMIYGQDSDMSTDKILKVYSSIIQRIERGLQIRRESVFADSDGKNVRSVLAGADMGKGVVIIYDAFFKKAEGDEKNLNARGSVIIHELAHLVGLEEDCEQESLSSAECLRNFTLLVCEIVKPEDLFVGDEEANEENSQLEGKNGELPNNPNHHPAGSSKGGQFAPKGGGDSGSGGKDGQESKSGTEKPDTPKSDSQSKRPEAGAEKSAPKIPKTPEELAQNRKEIEDILKSSPEIPVDYGMNDDSFSVDPNNGPSGEDYLIWGTSDIKIDKLEPDTDYTVWMQGEYTYKDPETGESKTETAEWAYQVKSNADGEIDIERVGIINQDRANDVQNYKGGDLDINVNVAPIKGTVEDNFGTPDKVGWNPQKDAGETSPNTYESNENNPNFTGHSAYGLGSYGASHAGMHSDGEKGGGVNGRIPKNKPIGSNSINFKIDGEKETVKSNRTIRKTNTSNDMKKSGRPLKRD